MPDNNEDLLFGAVEEVVAKLNDEESDAEETEPPTGEEEADHEEADEDPGEEPDEQESEAGEQDEEGEDNPEPADEEPPKLLAGKYADVDALEKAHLEAQRKITELGQGKSELEKMRDEIAALKQAKEVGPEPTVFGDKEPQTLEELHRLAVSDPDYAAAWAAERNPEYMSDVIASINSVNPKKAIEIQGEWLDYQNELRMQPLLEEQQQHHEKTIGMAAANEFALMKPDYAELGETFTKALNKRQGTVDKTSKDAVLRAFINAYNEAKVELLESGDTAVAKATKESIAKATNVSGTGKVPPAGNKKSKLSPEEQLAEDVGNMFLEEAGRETNFYKRMGMD